METTRVIQLAGVIFCLVLVISEVCHCYPPSYSSAEEDNIGSGIREMLEDLERQGLIRTLMPHTSYLSSSSNNVDNKNRVVAGHDIMTRKFPRSGSTSNLRLRYGKRSSMPRLELMGISSATEDSGVSTNNGVRVNGQRGNFKVINENI